MQSDQCTGGDSKAIFNLPQPNHLLQILKCDPAYGFDLVDVLRAVHWRMDGSSDNSSPSALHAGIGRKEPYNFYIRTRYSKFFPELVTSGVFYTQSLRKSARELPYKLTECIPESSNQCYPALVHSDKHYRRTWHRRL